MSDGWETGQATGSAGAVCECGSDTFTIGVNGESDVRVSCAECETAVAYCWDGDAGSRSGKNDLKKLEPKQEADADE